MLRSETYSFEFSVNECNPTHFLKSSDQSFFKNQTTLTYYINNGTQTLRNPFETAAQFLPSCTENYFSRMGINYNYKAGEDRNIFQVSQLIQLEYKNASYSQFVIKADSERAIREWDIEMELSVYHKLNPSATYTAHDAFRFNLNVTYIPPPTNSAPFFDKWGTKL